MESRNYLGVGYCFPMPDRSQLERKRRQILRNAEEINEDKLIGDDGRVINNQSTIFRQLDGTDSPLGSLSGRRAKPFDGEVPQPVATPTKEQSDNPFACVLCF